MKLLKSVFARVSALGVATQLYCSFGLLLVLTAMVAAAGLVGLSRVSSEASALNDKWLQGVGALADARRAIVETREFEVKHSRTEDRSYHSEYDEKIDGAIARAAKSLDVMKGLLQAEDERKEFAALSKNWASYVDAVGKVRSLGKAKKQADAADISDGLAATGYDDAMGDLEKLFKRNFAGGAAAAASAAAAYSQSRLIALVLSGAALVCGALLAWVITRRLQAQLGGEPHVAAHVAAAVAAGDLTTPITLREGDRSSLMAQLDAMQNGLRDAVLRVRQGAEHVASASAEIAHGNQDLSGRTEQQASTLQETAATMEELGTTVKHNADNARQANQLAQGASTVAQKGGGVVREVVDTMKGINESSKKIADIISVIDGIAFQTNILALNAAVEAARAGEQGRGFAVVAGEVRSLAQRSAEAAKEIKSLINASVERVDRGSSLVDQAGQTMSEIVGAIQRVTDVVGEISSASAEQSSGVEQVSQAVSGMDRTTQQNAALVEQSAAAAENLKQQAQQLLEAVAVFRTANAAG